jgi:hypothetical protein
MPITWLCFQKANPYEPLIFLLNSHACFGACFSDSIRSDFVTIFARFS